MRGKPSYTRCPAARWRLTFCVGLSGRLIKPDEREHKPTCTKPLCGRRWRVNSHARILFGRATASVAKRINNLRERPMPYSDDVVGTGPQTGLSRNRLLEARKSRISNAFGRENRRNDLFSQRRLRAPCPLARVMFIAIRIRCSGAWSPQDPDTTKRQPSMFSRFVRIPAESPNF
jgi:hypothetical protein